MTMPSGDLSLLDDPLAVELLASRVPARLAYLWFDGTPRVVPIWFHWDGAALVVCSPPKAPKLKALEQHPEVSVTIDSNEWPYKVLSLRGSATVSMVDDLAPEYAAAAERYLGPVEGRAWAAQLRGKSMGRVSIQPQWANLLDFETRFPSALSA
jgi:nitroimidazol reductase NimA-like FMN-containing flavoprotein (pyridoxamine 5'-phosphate oxidase superfamily)